MTAIWNFTCRCDRLETGYYRATVAGATSGKSITREGAYPMLLLLRVLGEAMKARIDEGTA